MNAKMGNNNMRLESVTGNEVLRKRNDNGNRLIEFSEINEIHTETWISPGQQKPNPKWKDWL